VLTQARCGKRGDLLGEHDRIVKILTEVLLARWRDAAIAEFGANPLLAAFVVGAGVPNQSLRRARSNTTADIEIAPIRFVLGNLELDDLGFRVVGNDKVPLVGSHRAGNWQAEKCAQQRGTEVES
jgi:hypothetical protein